MDFSISFYPHVYKIIVGVIAHACGGRVPVFLCACLTVDRLQHRTERWTTRDVKNAREYIPSVLGAKRKIEMTNIVYSLVIVVILAQTGRNVGASRRTRRCKIIMF